MAVSSIYDRALRVIGQDLSDINPETVEITLEGDAFVVRGTTVMRRRPKKKARCKKPGTSSFPGKANRNSPRRHTSPSRGVTVSSMSTGRKGKDSPARFEKNTGHSHAR